MKKFILLFLLIPSLCFAVEPIDFSKSIAMSPAMLGGSAGAAAGATGFCSGCTQTGSNKLCESFENTDCAAGWSADTDATYCAVNYSNAASSGIGCTDAGTKSIKLTQSAGSFWACFAKYTFATASNVYMVASFYLSTHDENQTIFTIRNSSDNYIMAGINANTNHTLSFLVGVSVVATSTNTFTHSQWTPIRVTFIQNTQLKIEVDWDNNGSYTSELDTSTSIPDDTALVIKFGNGTSAWLNMVMEWDQIRIDSSAMPDSCAR